MPVDSKYLAFDSGWYLVHSTDTNQGVERIFAILPEVTNPEELIAQIRVEADVERRRRADLIKHYQGTYVENITVRVLTKGEGTTVLRVVIKRLITQ